MAHQVTVLVVETNFLIASAVEGPLLREGFKVVVAMDEAEADAAIASSDIEVAIIDFRLQHGGPKDLASRLTALGIPYIFCTASSTAEVIEHFPGAHILEKPFSDDTLLASVTTALRPQAEPPAN